MVKYKNTIIKNIFYMLAYVYDQYQYKDISKLGNEEFNNFENLYAAIITTLMKKQLKMGIARSYVDKVENISNLKGKINLSESIKINSIVNRRLVCEYDDYTEDIMENKVIKYTLLQMLKNSDVSKELKTNIKGILRYLSEVNVGELNKNTIIYTSFNISDKFKNYKLILYVCYLYNNSLLLNILDEDESLYSYSNHQEIHSLYENFVLKYYRYHYPNLKAKGTELKWNENSNNSILPSMYTDINLYGEDTTLIIDTKFYSRMYSSNWNKKSAISSHIFQMYAYLSNYSKSIDSSKKVIGLLLYAETANEEPLYQKEKINKFDLKIQSLNLNQDFLLIQKQLNEIAKIVL